MSPLATRCSTSHSRILTKGFIVSVVSVFLGGFFRCAIVRTCRTLEFFFVVSLRLVCSRPMHDVPDKTKAQVEDASGRALGGLVSGDQGAEGIDGPLGRGASAEGMAPAGVTMHVHDGEHAQVGGVLRLVAAASASRPLPARLMSMCAEVARLADADVASVYLLENVKDSSPSGTSPKTVQGDAQENAEDTVDGDSDAYLVMRANVGFPDGALGKVRMRVGEGITGFAAECMRPISVTAAGQDRRNKPFPELGEENYPILLALPLAQGANILGVLVLQRRKAVAFTSGDVALLAALAAPFVYAVDRAMAESQTSATKSGALGAPRSALLPGRAWAAGIQMGRAYVPNAVGSRPGVRGADGDAIGQLLESSLSPEKLSGLVGGVRTRLQKGHKALAGKLSAEMQARLASRMMILEDARFQSTLAKAVERKGLSAGLKAVAREYANVPFRVSETAPGMQAAVGAGIEGGPNVLALRAREVEGLCGLLTEEAIKEVASSGAKAQMHGGAVWLSDDPMGALLLLANHKALSGIVIGEDLYEDDLTVALAEAAGIPLVASVAGVFSWARPGDTVLVDGASAVVRINPPAHVVAGFRHRKSRP